MLNVLTKILGGDKSSKEIKQLTATLNKINDIFKSYELISNDDLRAKSAELKNRIKNHLSEVDKQIHDLHIELVHKSDTHHDLHGTQAMVNQQKNLSEKRNKQTEVVLWEILPEAFALVKETARRFSVNSTLSATATALDKTLSTQKTYITIENDQVHYSNTWNVAGKTITWNMVHFDVQLLGGIILHQGKIAEMGTGEGKTLVSTLPAYLNALAGNGVHIVTVNDYLARRDAEWNAPLFEWLGLTVGCINNSEPHSDARRAAYNCDITYGTNNEFGFDYLRDNMVRTKQELTQRAHHYAIIDEVDSVLIDDARTPLIISGPIPASDDHKIFTALKPRIAALVEAQRQLVTQYLLDAKSKLAQGNEHPEEIGLDLMRAYKGLPQNSTLIKLLSEPGVKVKLQKAESFYMENQQKEMHKVERDLYFVIDEKNKSVTLTEKGISYITKEGEDQSLFTLPDIAVELSKIDEDGTLTTEEKMQQKDVLVNAYTKKSNDLHVIQQLLKAYTLFKKDVEYVVADGQVKIVDEQTGRIMEGRRYSDGLHQALEAKENVNIEVSSQTYATISLQNYFRMYFKLSGMTGTAETESAEFLKIYNLDVTVIPTHKPVIRDDKDDLIYKTKREKYNAVIQSIEANRTAGRPTLVGTTSVEASELISKILTQRKIPHNVLNAKQHAKEANIIAEAGVAGAVTIATNMAGRGTDITLGKGVKESGGLMIIGTERHESRRVDRQLRGRAGRQGDPGGSQFFVSLEDDLMRLFGSERIAKWMDRFGLKEGEVIQHSMVTSSITRAQKKVEENNFGIRKRLLDYDDVMNKQRGIIYEKRKHALYGEQLQIDIDNAIYALISSYVHDLNNTGDKALFEVNCLKSFGVDVHILIKEKNIPTHLVDTIYNMVIEKYNHKKTQIIDEALPIFKHMSTLHADKPNTNVVVPYTDGKHTIQVATPLAQTISTEGRAITAELEKSIILVSIDNAWKEHLRNMENLRQSVQTAYLEQKDPLVIYKIESFNLFDAMNTELNEKFIAFLLHASILRQDESNVLMSDGIANTKQTNMITRKDEIQSRIASKPNQPTHIVEKSAPVRVEQKTGRNDACPCGSGKKYKHCHGTHAAGF